MTQTIPRPLQNNNPLNIKVSTTNYVGKVPRALATDSDFEQFKDVFFGIQAAFTILRQHIQQDRRMLVRTTVARELDHWSPTAEKAADYYLKFVCEHGVLDEREVLDFSNKNQVCRLLWAMAHYECELQLPFNYFERAYEMAKR